MTGEKLAWFLVASHLRIPLYELKARITYSEFLDWLTFIEMEDQRNRKIDFALAQIAAEIRRGRVKHPNKVKVKDFLIELVAAKPAGLSSKQIWAAALGIDLKKN